MPEEILRKKVNKIRKNFKTEVREKMIDKTVKNKYETEIIKTIEEIREIFLKYDTKNIIPIPYSLLLELIIAPRRNDFVWDDMGKLFLPTTEIKRHSWHKKLQKNIQNTTDTNNWIERCNLVVSPSRKNNTKITGKKSKKRMWLFNEYVRNMLKNYKKYKFNEKNFIEFVKDCIYIIKAIICIYMGEHILSNQVYKILIRSTNFEEFWVLFNIQPDKMLDFFTHNLYYWNDYNPKTTPLKIHLLKLYSKALNEFFSHESQIISLKGGDLVNISDHAKTNKAFKEYEDYYQNIKFKLK